jgi:hypothetical protein
MEKGELNGLTVPVKFIACLLFGDRFDPAASLYPALAERLGKVDWEGKDHPFDVTDYYEKEMGPGLKRRVVSFSGTGCASELAGLKRFCADVEARFAAEGKRRVNIDIGYIDYFKVVLASFKEGPQKIYLGDGVYADMVLMYQNGEFAVLPWSFPDIRTGRYMEDFTEIRKIYKEERQ